MSRGSAPTWDPDRYLAHADERGRPFVELAAGPDYAACTEGVAEPASHDPETYLRERFTAELAARLREAYPPQRGGVVLPFRRVFVVAQR